MLFHELAHVDAHHGGVVEQEGRKLCQFGLPTPVGLGTKAAIAGWVCRPPGTAHRIEMARTASCWPTRPFQSDSICSSFSLAFQHLFTEK